MGGAYLHEDQLAVTDAIVSSLIERGAPDLGFPPLSQLPSTGPTNALYKRGDQFLVRLPCRREDRLAMARNTLSPYTLNRNSTTSPSCMT